VGLWLVFGQGLFVSNRDDQYNSLSMNRLILPRYFISSVLLLLVLASLYVFSEAQRLQRELLRQTEAKAMALAEAMATNVKNVLLGNSLLEELIGQRLLDNARLIDQLLLARPVDRKLLGKIAEMNRLQKIDLLDLKGRPLRAPLVEPMPQEMVEEMLARLRRIAPADALSGRETVILLMWGRRWRLPQEEKISAPEPPRRLAERKFWEGSIFGVAIEARSFPGIIAVHANADYILNFRREIEVQRQIEELGRQADIHHVALLDNSLKILAHTDRRAIHTEEKDPLIMQVQASGEALSRLTESASGSRYEIVKPIRLDDSTLGFLEIGLSVEPMQAAWRKSLQSMVALALVILAVGILGMATIFYNQHSHLRKIRSLEAEISRQERLSEMGNLAATVAHEIRNPLNSISMGLQRLNAEFSPTQDHEQYSRFIDLMQGEVHRLNSIVEQFLSLARPLELSPETLRAEELFQELSTLVAGDPKRSAVQFRITTPADLPAVRADRNYLKQVLLNLALNGIQAMPQGGTLALEAGVRGGRLVLTVADEGGGIPPEILPRIFEPYFTTKANGSGLGLAIARRIVEAHGGELTAESRPGAGSRFHVSLPLPSGES
jgi:signal transduction histidine kinase